MANKSGQYLTFKLRSEFFGIPIADIREINQCGDVTPVPHSAQAVKGVMNLRGKIIPVVNLRVKFGMIDQEITKESCIIVIEAVCGQVGVIVDSVNEVIDLRDDQIEDSPSLAQEGQTSLVTGVGKLEKHVVLLVDIKTAFASDGLSEIRDAA